MSPRRTTAKQPTSETPAASAAPVSATPSTAAPLQRYRAKRVFPGTPEPDSGAPKATGDLSFVIQKHAASRLHYDFRLEIEGVLKSWAVPKGPSADPAEKRMAVFVEDHPLDYGTFEGVIPERHYGAGNVIVWDYGVYSPDEGGLSWGDKDEANARMLAGLEAGKLSFTLRGAKLQGSWTLVRTKPKDGATNQWLLIKHRDEHVTEAGLLTDDVSVLTGRTLDEVSRGVAAPPGVPAGPAEPPGEVRPMLAGLGDKAFSHPDWLFEPKLDGVRIVAWIDHGRVTLRSREGNDVTDHYPEVTAALATQPHQRMVLDGEVVALNEQGVPEFGLLQHRMHLSGTRATLAQGTMPVLFYAFDLLYLEGIDLRPLPLEQRKRRLTAAVRTDNIVQVVEAIPEEGEAFFKAAAAMGLEGMVAKRRDSTYQPGQRSPHWVKVKAVQQQEFVVGGYLPGEGWRASTFGSLVLGYHEDGVLKCAGTVGSGFTDAEIKRVWALLTKLRAGDSPFDGPIPRQAEQPVWVRPELVALVKYGEWTRNGTLRAPVYLGLRDDKPAAAVVRERPLQQSPGAAVSQATSPAGLVVEVCRQLDAARDSTTLQAGEWKVPVTNLNKEFWPPHGKRPALTKRDMIRYYALVSPYILPHLHDRPMNLTRYVSGATQARFYQKHWEYEPPPFVEMVHLYSSSNEKDQDYVMVQNLPTLLWLAQLASIELHPWLSRATQGLDAPDLAVSFAKSEAAIDASVLNYPDYLIFDLDPYTYSGKEKPGDEPELNAKAFGQVRQVATTLREVLEGVGLQAFIKTTGQTGLHIYVPVMRHYPYHLVRKACETIGKYISGLLPGMLTLEWAVQRRTGKVFFDYNQNVRGKTLAAPYSLRPSALATVSLPIEWDELPTIYPTDFTIATVPDRLAKRGDAWGSIMEHKHDLRPLLEGA